MMDAGAVVDAVPAFGVALSQDAPSTRTLKFSVPRPRLTTSIVSLRASAPCVVERLTLLDSTPSFGTPAASTVSATGTVCSGGVAFGIRRDTAPRYVPGVSPAALIDAMTVPGALPVV